MIQSLPASGHQQKMQAKTPPDSSDSRLADTPSSYGWLSIAIHWATGVIVIALWLLGQSIDSAGSAEADGRRALHVSIAASAWLLLLFRIAWRFREGHPRVAGLGNLTHGIAKAAHYLMLLLLCIMLVSGPAMVWAGGNAISLFGAVTIPAPVRESIAVAEFAHTAHIVASRGLVILVVLHVAGALKHLMFHSDDTIVRMLWPPRRKNVGGSK